MNDDPKPVCPLPLLDELGVAYAHPIDPLLDKLRHQQVVKAAGLGQGYLAATLTQIARRLDRTILILTATYAEGLELSNDLVAFGAGQLNREVLILPPPDTSPYSGVSPDRNRIMDRVSAQFRMAMGEGGQFLVVPVESAMRRLVPWKALEDFCTVLSTGERHVDLAELRRILAQGGYQAVPLVEAPGTFAIRGGLLDLFSPLLPNPVRIDLLGSEIESIRFFDPQTQRTLQPVSEVFITPVREEILTAPRLAKARTRIRATGDHLALPSSLLNEIVQDLENGAPVYGLEPMLPALHDLESPLAMSSSGALWVLVDPTALHEQAGHHWERRQREYEQVVEAGDFAFPPEAYFLDPDALARQIDHWTSKIEITALGGDDTLTFRCQTNEDIHRLRKMQEGMEGTVHALTGRLAEWKEHYGRIAFACRSTGSAERLSALLRSYGENAVIVDGPIPAADIAPPPCREIHIHTLRLSAGFRTPFFGLAVVSDAEVFGQAARRSSARIVEEALTISHFRELSPGNLVVHLDFGIARYHGMENLVLDDIAGDYLKLEFAGNDKLYLPIHRLSRVQKYMAGDRDYQPSLDKLGSNRWHRSKAKIKKDMEELADELLRLYSERKTRAGHAFSFAEEYFREFEATFPYEETPHQQAAIEEVVADMCAEQPMDRLLCGDVGFGKTEVAIRASFVAVLDGMQVAVLVPTTVLAEQHLSTFSERLRMVPVRVEALSRFRSPKESKKIIDDLAQGKVDILIGTHRLLSDDVSFRKLGLLIIDEEQRFGVRHKEKLKQLKTTVDVLTMSATPIPRTLEMSLLGIRDLSVILTPPSDRLAVTTHLAPFREQVIREGIERELKRQGQIFFVHNRVQGIQEIARQIQELVPEARVAVAHAQMPDVKLERVMLDFVNRRTDVLVCTSIIESGLDITTANTIFINRADTFGLAQLYQLRGRVGRGRERAVCYLLLPERRKMTADALKRLEVIRTHSELASGISVAQHDLDIRGAGNLLGKDQSGEIRSVGYDLFFELLEEAIRERRGDEEPADLDPEVKIPVEAFLPSSFIPEEGLRLLFYKRLSMARTVDDLDGVVEEMADRFGRLPPPALTLRDIIAIKIDLAAMGIEHLEAGPNGIVLKLSERCRLVPAKVIDLVGRSQGRYILRQDMQLIRRVGGKEKVDLMGTTQAAIRDVQHCMA